MIMACTLVSLSYTPGSYVKTMSADGGHLGWRSESQDIILNGSGSGSAPRLNIFFDEIQNGAIWGHFRVSYNIESSTILMTLIEKNFLKFSKIYPSCLRTPPLLCTGPLQNLG